MDYKGLQIQKLGGGNVMIIIPPQLKGRWRGILKAALEWYETLEINTKSVKNTIKDCESVLKAIG